MRAKLRTLIKKTLGYLGRLIPALRVERLLGLDPTPSGPPLDFEIDQVSLRVHASTPGHLDVFIRDKYKALEPVYDNRTHLAAALKWLLEAQRTTKTPGFSAGYCFQNGWLPPYPETTGYIICTMWKAADLLKDKAFEDAALQAAKWEIDVQLDCGAIQAGYYGEDPDGFWRQDVVPAAFNTGQVMLGWNQTYLNTERQEFLDASVRAGSYLSECIDKVGIFRNGLSPGPTNPVRSYYTRVAHALIWTGELASEPSFVEVGSRHLNWVLTQQRDDGWIANAMFDLNDAPLTHNLAYAAEGLLDAGLDQGNDAWVEASRLLSEGAMLACERRGFFLPARLSEGWKSTDKFSCLTGNAQFAGLWLRHGMRTGDLRFLNAGLKMVDWLKGLQSLNNPNPGIRGGIAGAWPIDGGYSEFRYLNWATKFYADALILSEPALEGLKDFG